jgi:hypothetical protein
MIPTVRWSGRLSELAPLVMSTSGTHVVQLYDEDVFLLDTLARVVGEALDGGEAVVAIATKRHREAVEALLAATGIDVAKARDEERFVCCDAAELLATFTVGGMPDETRFAASLGALVDRAAKVTLSGRVRVFGEMVAVLWGEGHRAGAIALEMLWSRLLASRPSFSLMCAYPLAVFAAADDSPRFATMCHQHTHVVPAESYAKLDTAGDRLRAIARLQQKALVLDSMTTRGSHGALTVACKRCRGTLLRAEQIGNGEVETIAFHLRTHHQGVVADGPVMLGDILREVLVDAA